MKPWQQPTNTASQYSAIALGFSIPLSTALMSIFSILTIVLVIASGNWREKWQLLKRNPLAITALLLFALLIIGCFYSIAPMHDRVKELQRYHGLVFLAFLLPIFQEKKWRNLGLLAFSTAMFIQLVGGTINGVFLGRESVIAHDHISIGVMMSFICFTWLHLAMQAQGKKRYLLFGLVMATVAYLLFVNTGRTAYVCFFVLLLLSALQIWHWRGVLLAIVVGMILAAGSYYFSPVFHRQVNRVIEHTLQYSKVSMDITTTIKKDDENAVANSTGIRLRWMHYAVAMLKANPVLGVGTGGFEEGIKTLFPDDASMFWTDKPHNDVLTIAAQLGIVGLLVLLALYVAHAYMSLRIKSPDAYYAQLLLLVIIVAGIFNSALRDGVLENFYIYLVALLLAQYRSQVLSQEQNG